MGIDNDEIKICRTTLKILQYSLIWPSQDDEMDPGKWYYIRVGSFLLITSGWVLSVFMHCIMVLINDVDIRISEDIGLLVAFIGVYSMVIIYVRNQPKIAHLLKDLSNFEKFGRPPDFEQEEDTLSYWSKFCFFYTVFGIIGYNLIKLYQKPNCERRNQERGLHENCGFLSPTWFPFEVMYFPVFELMFLYIFISTQILMKLALMISYNALEMAHHIMLRINHLNIMIGECFDDEDYDKTKSKLERCVSYHLDILNLSSRLNDCFANCMFTHLTITAAICGCLEKQFVDSDDSNGKICAFIHVFGWVMALFVACIGGQHFINSGDSIPEAIWSSKWYETHPNLRKDLLFMLSRSQRGLHIDVGSFSILSFALFVSVMKMSYSILAMLTS